MSEITTGPEGRETVRVASLSGAGGWLRGGVALLLLASVALAIYESITLGASPFAHVSACLAGTPPEGVFTVFGHCLWCWTGLAAFSALIATLPDCGERR